LQAIACQRWRGLRDAGESDPFRQYVFIL